MPSTALIKKVTYSFKKSLSACQHLCSLLPGVCSVLAEFRVYPSAAEGFIVLGMKKKDAYKVQS